LVSRFAIQKPNPFPSQFEVRIFSNE
jgi:hypothetical protein